MTDYSMRFRVPDVVPSSIARSRFFWVTDSSPDSFVSTLLPTYRALGPRLGALGPVREANIELVRLAVLVFAADRSTPRKVGTANWSRRELNIEVPVADPARWEPIRDRMEDLLGFLSGDLWTITFHRARAPKETVRENPFLGATRAVLLSGGADSAVGALLSRQELGDDQQVLVSHVGLTTLAPLQRDIGRRIEALVNGPEQFHQQIHISRHSKQVDGVRFRDEPSSRTRSLLFLALGLAVASMNGVPLLIPENGFATLNPPLTPDQRGSLSTRTTHPLFLEQLAELAIAAGAHAVIENPLAEMTKGEMFTRVVDLVGQEEASRFLSATYSCSHTGHRSFKLSLLLQCGVCFGCLLRRAAFLASGVKDQTKYLSALQTGRPDAYLQSKSMEASLYSFVSRGVRAADLASMTLPPTYSTVTARRLCEQAISELRLLFL